MQSNGVNCLLRIKESLHALSPMEKKMAAYILDHPDQAINLPIDDLAAKGGVSTSTVNRMCRSLGFTGYKEFSMNLYSVQAAAKESVTFEDIRAGDAPATVLRNISLSSIKAIRDTVAMTDTQTLEAAVDVLCKAKRIDFYGLGASGLVALDAGSKFLRCGKTSFAFTSPHEQILAALTLKKDDVAVLISYSGETIDILKIAQDIRAMGATIISITRFGKNALSEMADIRLHSSSAETMLRAGAMSSRIAQLCVVDTLFASVCSRIFPTVKHHLELTRTSIQRLHTSQGSEKG